MGELDMDWPVAPIPTPDEPTITDEALLPLRWPMHGTLRLVVAGWRSQDTADPWLVVDDVLELLELDATGVTSTPATGTWRDTASGGLRACWRLGDALRVVQDHPTHQTAAFLAWLHDSLPLVMTPEAIDAAVPPSSYVDAWDFASAALHLSRTGLPMTRQGLILHLQDARLIARDREQHWAPTPLAVRRGWLTIRDRKLPAGQGLYSQVHITHAGLAEIRRQLSAISAPVLFEEVE